MSEETKQSEQSKQSKQAESAIMDELTTRTAAKSVAKFGSERTAATAAVMANAGQATVRELAKTDAGVKVHLYFLGAAVDAAVEAIGERDAMIEAMLAIIESQIEREDATSNDLNEHCATLRDAAEQNVENQRLIGRLQSRVEQYAAIIEQMKRKAEQYAAEIEKLIGERNEAREEAGKYAYGWRARGQEIKSLHARLAAQEQAAQRDTEQAVMGVRATIDQLLAKHNGNGKPDDGCHRPTDDECPF